MGKLTFVEEGNSYQHGDKLWVMPRAVRQIEQKLATCV